MTRLLSAFSLLVMLAAALAASGCIKRMKMPSEELMWQPAPDRFERGAERFEEVGRLEEVNGRREFSIGTVIASEDGALVAASVGTRWDSVPGEPNYAKVRRNSQVGVLIWSPEDGRKEWVDVPEPYPGHGDGPVPLAFSADGTLLAVERDERVSIWSRAEQRVLCTFRVSDEEKITFPREGGAQYSVTVRLDTPKFSRDGREFSAIITRLSDSNLVTWSVQTGECSDKASAELPSRLGEPRSLPSAYEGLEPGSLVARVPIDPLVSPGRRYIAAFFVGTTYLWMGDATPRHVRVWDTGTERLVSWSGTDKEASALDSPRPLEFLKSECELLFADSGGIHIVNVVMRQIVATLPCALLPVLGVVDLHWFPKSRMLSIEGTGRLTLVKVRE